MKKMYRDELGNLDIKFLFNLNNYLFGVYKIIFSVGFIVFRDFFLNNGEEVELSRLFSNIDFCLCFIVKESRLNIGKKSSVKDMFYLFINFFNLVLNY